ncbi:hypothetical protein KI387_030422, partial [Taxus chinensis]
LRLPGGNAELRSPSRIPEAQSFIIVVKEHFKDDEDKYDEFLHILEHFLSKT